MSRLWISRRSRLSLDLPLPGESCTESVNSAEADSQSQTCCPRCSRCGPFQQGRPLRDGNSVQEGGGLFRMVHRRQFISLCSCGLGDTS